MPNSRQKALRVEGDRAPERLQIAADEAARSGDLRTTIEYASGARHAIQLWDEFRVWESTRARSSWHLETYPTF